MVRLLLIFTLCTITAISAVAQEAAVLRDIARTQQLKSERPVPRGANFFRREETSELRFLLSGVVRVYQLLISSQDTDVCAYEPSCSRFGMLSMQRFGVVRGFLLTADRLNRCNGLTDSQHDRNLETGKMIDPVEGYDQYLHTHR